MTARERFSEIFERETDALFRFCLWRTSDRELAVEFAQEAFARLWQEMSVGREIPNPQAFLFLVAKRLVIDWYRKRKPLSLDREFGEGLAFDPRDEGAVEAIEAAPDVRRALELIGELDEQYRDAVYLRFAEDLPPREIAAILGLTPNAVSIRLTRGLKALRALWGIKDK